jgi:hypothetical protein
MTSQPETGCSVNGAAVKSGPQVDDELATRRFLRKSLRAEGYEVIEEEAG